MKIRIGLARAVIALGLAVALPVSAAYAQNGGGMDLAWNDCGATGVRAKSFACSSNTLNFAILIVSAASGVDMPQLNGEETVMYVQTNQPSIPAWWHLESGGCRGPSALILDYDFTSGPFTCLDPWAGQASGSLTYTVGDPSPTFARLQTDGAIPGVTSILGTEEYYLSKIRILGDKTTGTGSCAGCSAGACLVLYSVTLTQPAGAPGGSVRLTQPLLSNYVTFQPGVIIGGICGMVPTRITTWGSIKSLYR